jgi:pimeloyl-ACP methyl ester carboxylesterase
MTRDGRQAQPTLGATALGGLGAARSTALRNALRVALSVAIGSALLVSCATKVTVPEAERPPNPLSPQALSLAAPGPSGVAVNAGSMKSSYGCAVSYEVYTPARPRTEAMVFLAHGFARDLTRMRGWARLWASHGVPTTIMSFCNSTFTSGHHDRNAEDLRALAAQLHAGPVMYAGFSAGGLASLLAASTDPRAIAWLGLDPVDSGGLAGPALARLTVPAFALLGEASSCNDGNNMLPILSEQARVAVLQLRHTVHCMFEDPSDPGCASLCGSVEPADASADATLTIRALATAWVLEQTGAAGATAAGAGAADATAAGAGAEGAPLTAGSWGSDAQWQGRVRVLQAGSP